MEELIQWKTIKEYPDYKISNLGIVKNFKTVPEKEISQRLRNGYNVVRLYDGPRSQHYSIHRLIAIYFIENPDPVKFKLVDHIDGDKLNNDITNLRWTNASGNKKNWDSNRTNYNKVIQYNLEGEELKIWDSAASAAKELKFNSSSLCNCCGHRRLTYKGFIWRYENYDRKRLSKPITDLTDYICIGIINGDDFSNYYIFKDGSKIININLKKELTFYTTPDNYKIVTLYPTNDNKTKVNLAVHKIINQVINNGKYEDIVDHVNGKRDDNSIDNLEAVTHKENTIRAIGRGVKQINVKTGETKVFRTIKEAYVSLNKSPTGLISAVCKEKRKSAYGYKWEYV